MRMLFVAGLILGLAFLMLIGLARVLQELFVGRPR
jgi:hypothetical protein